MKYATVEAFAQPETLFSKHHRRPRHLGGGAFVPSGNLIKLPMEDHIAWHKLFGAMSAHEIATLINEKYLDPEFKMVCVQTKKIKRRLPCFTS